MIKPLRLLLFVAFSFYKIMEIWKKIEGFENYEISNFGRVKSTNFGNTKVLIQEKVKGYLRVTFSKNNVQKRFLVHRLVAKYFIKNNVNKICVNHIDGNKTNNNYFNLEWVTYSENEKHSYNTLGKINAIRKLLQCQIIDIRTNCIKGTNQNNKGNVIDFMLKYNVSRNTILNVLNKKYYAQIKGLSS